MKLLNKVHPHFVSIVTEALKAEFPGGPIDLKKVSSDNPHDENIEGLGYFFTFSLPYAGTRVDWDVWFLVEQPDLSPDFLCSSEDFDYDHTVYMTVMKDWNFNDPFCLFNLLTKLNGIYRTYQEEQMAKYPKIQETVKSLIDAQIPEVSIETCYSTQQKKYTLLIKLEVSDEDLPVAADLSSSQLYAGLLFLLQTNGNIQSESLILSPYLSNLLGDLQGKMHVPSYSGTLVTPRFVTEFKSKLTDILGKIQEEQKRRREIVASLLTIFPNNLVDYDSIEYTEAVVIFKVDESRYMLLFNLLDSDWDVTLFALDRSVKTFLMADEPIVFNETEKLSFTNNPTGDGFTKYFHDWLSAKIKKFIASSKVVNQIS